MFKILKKKKSENENKKEKEEIKQAIKKEKKEIKQASKKEKEKIKQIPSKVTDVLPFLDIKNDYIIQKDEVMDIIEIEGKDILSLTVNELERDINIFHTFYKTVKIDTKLVSMNFPVNAQKQKDYIDYKISKTNNQIYKVFLKDKKNELEYLEKNRTNKEYYLFLFAPSIEILKAVKKTVNRTISNALNTRSLTIEKKKLILYKLNNKNSKIDTGRKFSD
ncbi:hypothetical protein LGL08_22195 [Clostridium estertheticum]|uniref:hypothetical protein n=1 Tax=Clostridium estertheticum TaxID=238834 RepID=UPI001CF311D3|nr:hypothetical protein [Clostridium estertheticum]MCB2309252.1 hypothetical protein [Clostridium estertheticum]MCB2346895.1 hypothetical protein [Clostridium estertheticum]MCB2352237.1 hypothetical protein [Clostridium estertheticum]WAG48558.1 hypothetical protein LL127_23605 [Clostridium estertheticum]